MLVNLCFHISLTCAVFVGGINQTQHPGVCQAVSTRRTAVSAAPKRCLRLQRLHQKGKQLLLLFVLLVKAANVPCCLVDGRQ